MTKENLDTIIPIHIHKIVGYGKDKHVKIEHIEQERYFHKIYISIKEGKVYSNKIIVIRNENMMEFGGTIFIKGTSLEKDLVNGSEIL